MNATATARGQSLARTHIHYLVYFFKFLLDITFTPFFFNLYQHFNFKFNHSGQSIALYLKFFPLKIKNEKWNS